MSTLELENIKHPDNSGDNLTLDSNGNIGIGVTPAAWWSNATAVQISPVGALYNTSNYEDLNLSNNAYFNSSGTESYIQDDGACKIRLTDVGLMDFRVAGAGTAGSAISWNTALAIDSSGRVKIGTNETTIGDQQLFISGTKTSFVTLGYSLWQNQLAVHDNRVPSGGAGTEAGVGGSISFTANAGGGQKTWLGLVEGYKQNSTAGDYGGGLKMRVRQHNNPTMLTGISINSNGYVTTPNQPYFAAVCAGNSAYSTFGQGVALPFNSTAKNEGNHFNTTSYRFTAPVTGKYSFNVGFITNSANPTGRPAFFVNGNQDHLSIKFGINGSNTAGAGSTSASAIIHLSANDYVDVRSQSGNIIAYTGGGHSSFTGILIS
jgi:hypothetical protein